MLFQLSYRQIPAMFCKPFTLKSHYLFVLLLFAGLLSAQTDTAYVKSYYNKLVPRGLYNYRN